ncbi:MAG: hypothetical protein C0498_13845 [Anaerolinea sp.]|nr:hypothetical protein [Anaerolinea sp.]
MDRVRNVRTGVVITHRASIKIFKSLVKAITPQLTHAVLLEFRDGTTFEETALQRMTERAAASARAGMLFTAKPGRRLSPE